MSSEAVSHYYTPEEYLEREHKAETKSEYFDGRVYAMAGTSRPHNQISLNIGSEFRFRLRGGPCEAYSGDMRVRVEATGLYTYPDVSVVCGEQSFDSVRMDTLLNPTLLVEILSPSTEAYDRGRKFAQYQNLESLQTYVLIAQDAARVEVYTRQGDVWTQETYVGLDATVALPAIGCELPLREIYERVQLPTNPPLREVC